MSIRPAAFKLALFVVFSLALTLVVTNTVTRPLGTSTERIWASLSRCTRTPSVTATPVNE